MPTPTALHLVDTLAAVLDRPEGAISENIYARVVAGEARIARPQWPQVAALAARAEREVEALTAVPNAPFRERLLYLLRTGQVTCALVCTRLGGEFIDGRGTPETTRLQRMLGMDAQAGAFKTRKGASVPTYYPGGYRTTVPYDLGVRLAEALELDPVDAGV